MTRYNYLAEVIFRAGGLSRKKCITVPAERELTCDAGKF